MGKARNPVAEAERFHVSLCPFSEVGAAVQGTAKKTSECCQRRKQMTHRRTRHLFKFLLIGISIFLFTLLLSTEFTFSADVWLTWDPNSEEDLMGYRIYYGYGSRDYCFSLEILDGVLCKVQNLEEGMTYYFAATAFDRDGNESDYSNEVVYTPPCIYSITPMSSFFDAAGGTGSIYVSAQSACSWSVISNISWLTVTSNSTGRGNGTIYFSVMPNPGTESRTGTLTAAGKTFSVTQAEVSQYNLTILKAGDGHGRVTTDPVGTLFPAGTVVTLTATPDPNSIFSGWSGSITGTSPVVTITMTADKTVTATFTLLETISTPATPSGPAEGSTAVGFTYVTGGSSSNLGHSVQYLFDWGDGTYSGWLPVGQTSDSKSWPSAGTYNVKAQARCATHPSVTSNWSPVLSVSILPPPPPPPNVSASDGTYTDRVRVTWEAAAGATGYKVFRNTSDDSSGAQQIGASADLSYDDMTVVEGTPYWYWVKAYSNFGDSEFSNGDSGYVALSWHSEPVNWPVYYRNNWDRSGTVTKPGAVRIRLHFSTISVEARYDHLRTDVGDDWSGDYSNVTSHEKDGNSIRLRLTSDYSITGYFIIDRVEWQGTATDQATKSGRLFQ